MREYSGISSTVNVPLLLVSSVFGLLGGWNLVDHPVRGTVLLAIAGIFTAPNVVLVLAPIVARRRRRTRRSRTA